MQLNPDDCTLKPSTNQDAETAGILKAGPPKDKGKVAYFSFMVLGVGIMLPWNALLTAVDYFNAEFPGKHTDRLFTVCFLPCHLLTLILCIHFHARINNRLRMLAGLAGYVFVMLAIPGLDAVSSGSSSLGTILLLVALTGVADGAVQGAIYGDAACLPQTYTQGLVSGTAGAGFLVCILRIITKASFDDSPSGLRSSAAIYFVISAVLCGACMLCYAVLLPRLPIIQYYQSLEGSQQSAPGGIDEVYVASRALELSPTLESNSPGRTRPGGISSLGDISNSSAAFAYHRTPFQELRFEEEQEFLESQSLVDGSSGPRQTSYWDVGVQIWQLALANFVIYVITLSIFPGFLAEDIASVDLQSWYPVLLITEFNLADWLGKSAPAMPGFIMRNPWSILWACCYRVAFVPAFFLAAHQGGGPLIIGFLTFLLGLSNGYLTAAAMMQAPSNLKGEDAQVAGNIMVLALVAGLCVGAGCGYLWLV